VIVFSLFKEDKAKREEHLPKPQSTVSETIFIAHAPKVFSTLVKLLSTT
jgi:hypothetical protein